MSLLRLVAAVAAATAAAFGIQAGAAAAAPRSDGSEQASPEVFRLVTSVPAGTLDAVGAGGMSSGLEVLKLPGPVLMSGGRPGLLMSYAAWGPPAAADSWALAVALSRFGSFAALRTIDTGTYRCGCLEHPRYPHTQGLSFFQTPYTSSFLTFSPIVSQDVSGRPLQTPIGQQSGALDSLGSFGPPFLAIDVGGAYGFLGAGYSPAVLAHMSPLQIAQSLAGPTNPLARRIDGLANLFAAAICTVTYGQPQSVCSSGGVTAAGNARLRSAVPPQRVVAQINLVPEDPRSNALGIGDIIKQGGSYGVVIVADGVKANHHDRYAIWLYNSPRDTRLLGFVSPGVGRNGRLSTSGMLLPSNAKHFRHIVVSRETSRHPKRPTHIVLQGDLQHG
jgi:hypothetical protein